MATPKAIRDLAKAMGGDWLDNSGNLEPQPEAISRLLGNTLHVVMATLATRDRPPPLLQFSGGIT